MKPLSITSISIFAGIVMLCNTVSERIDYIKTTGIQTRSNSMLVDVATREGILPIYATAQALTLAVRQEMSDRCILEDAVNGGYVANGSSTESLSTDVRSKMLKEGNLDSGGPDCLATFRDHMWYGV